MSLSPGTQSVGLVNKCAHRLLQDLKES